MRLIRTADLDGTHWRALWAADAHRHPLYLPAELHAGSFRRPSLYYLPPADRPPAAGEPAGDYQPAHLVAVDELGPVLGVILTIEQTAGRCYLSSYGKPLYLAEDRDAGPRRRRAAAKLVHRELLRLQDLHGSGGYHARDFVPDGQLSPFTELTLRAGGTVSPYLTQLLDLTRPLSELAAELRPGLRTVLRQGRPGYRAVHVGADTVTDQHISAFRALHVAFHGADLRPAPAWAAVLECVRSDAAFLVFGQQGDECVSASYFSCSDVYCNYTNAVNDRSQYGRGLSHLLLWRAVELARDRGCRWLELGERLYPGQHAALAAKYHSISHFKAGFGGTVAARLDLFGPPPDAS